MDRFVAMIWEAKNPAAAWQINTWSEQLKRASSKWINVLDVPGLRVFSYHHRGDGPIVTRLDGEDGIVIGPLFERSAGRKGRVRALANANARRVVATRGDMLIKEYWGNYVALWRDREKRATTVLRDPCGAVPCFMTQQPGVDLLFAHAEDVADFQGLSFTIDWDYLQAFILFDYFVTEHSGLKEVKELLAGQRLEIGAGNLKHFSWAWNGADIAAHPNLQSFEEAKYELRATAEDCFAAWGTEYRDVVVRLSGGLDSSIVLNLLRRVSDTKITAMHLLGTGYERYEDRLAKLAAAHAQVELIEIPMNPRSADLRKMLVTPRIARPHMQIMGVEGEEIVTRLCGQLSADCLMAGHGGDVLFLQRASAKHVLTDYLRLNGLGPDTLRIGYEAATLQSHSVWKSLSGAFSATILRRPWQPFAFLDHELISKHRLLTARGVQTVQNTYMYHPWLHDAAKLPRGIADQVLGFLTLHNYYSRTGCGLTRDMLHPLLSQPIAELALRTPTYVLGHGGLDRALERQTFADLIPDEVFRRIGKGGISHYQLQSMPKNADFLREFILNGRLLAHDFLDRAKTERMLSPNYPVHGGGIEHVYQLAVLEAWVSSWSTPSVRAAA
jgi:asparagine synthase (glutamine-hydrolysing)